MSVLRYDEDLFENPFFIKLERDYKELFERSTTNRWIICIPKFSIVGDISLTEEDFEDHILIPNPDNGNECNTVSKHVAVINQNEIVLGKGFTEGKKVSVLFEETFYNNKDESYRVCCVSAFFNKDITEDCSSDDASLLNPSTSYDDCLKILWGPHGASLKVKDQFDRLLLSFCGAYHKLEGEKIEKIVELVSSQVADAMQLVLRSNNIKKYLLDGNVAKMTNLKVAVEMYMMNALHKHHFTTITACVKEKDAQINKMTRNLAGIRLDQLGIRREFEENILAAKKEISRLNQFSTPTRRLQCLARVMNALSKPITGVEDVVMTTDDLLPLLIYLIIRSQIPNWMANLVYMKHFQQDILSQNDEFSFLLANVEAALDYICSGNVKPSKPQLVSRQTSGGITSTKEKFFQYVKFGDEAAVKLMLKQTTPNVSGVVSGLCHPLCTCDKCAAIISSSRQNTDTVSPQTRDDMGRTALHIAAINGNAGLIDILVKHGCLVDGTCYLGFTPLHYACQNGFQNIILLLVHFGACISVVDNQGNTPLHLCAKNGHEDCVKAILFLDILKNRLDVNARNDLGDTPLHLAAKWGYEGIVKFLLDTEVDPHTRNRKRQTPLDVAQNPAIKRALDVAIAYSPLVFVHYPGPIPSTKNVTPKTLPIDNTTNKKTDKTTPHSSDTTVVKPDLKIEVKSPVALIDNRSKDMMSPTTPVVVQLDPPNRKVKEKLFKAIKDRDIELVKFYLGWNDDVEEDEDSPTSPSLVADLCHPLCQCNKCHSIQKKLPRDSLHVNCQNQKGFSPLHVSVIEGNFEALTLFLRKGANVNIQNSQDVTPLHLACFKAKFEMVKLLVSHGANVNLRDEHGEIPLHVACAYSGPGTVLYLLQHSSTVNLANIRGNTPLHQAAAHNSLDTVRVLLDHGANPEVWNMHMHAPHHLTKNPDIEHLLLCRIDQNRKEKLSKFSNLNHESVEDQIEDEEKPDKQEAQPGKRLEEELSESIRHFDKHSKLKRSQTFDHSKPSLDSLGLKLSLSIQHFDKENLRHTQTLDRSSARLAPFKHSLSIQHFDVGTLRHVQSVDKSSPLYLLSLARQDSSYGNYADDTTPESQHDFSTVLNEGASLTIKEEENDDVIDNKGEENTEPDREAGLDFNCDRDLLSHVKSNTARGAFPDSHEKGKVLDEICSEICDNDKENIDTGSDYTLCSDAKESEIISRETENKEVPSDICDTTSYNAQRYDDSTSSDTTREYEINICKNMEKAIGQINVEGRHGEKNISNIPVCDIKIGPNVTEICDDKESGQVSVDSSLSYMVHKTENTITSMHYTGPAPALANDCMETHQTSGKVSNSDIKEA